MHAAGTKALKKTAGTKDAIIALVTLIELKGDICGHVCVARKTQHWLRLGRLVQI